MRSSAPLVTLLSVAPPVLRTVRSQHTRRTKCITKRSLQAYSSRDIRPLTQRASTTTILIRLGSSETMKCGQAPRRCKGRHADPIYDRSVGDGIAAGAMASAVQRGALQFGF